MKSERKSKNSIACKRQEGKKARKQEIKDKDLHQ